MFDDEIKKYKEFEKIIKKMDNLEDMERADSVIASVLEIKKVEEKLRSLQDDLMSKPETAMFYINLVNMSEEEVLFSKQKLSTKLKRERKKKENSKNEEE